jgi:hypothetical protein
MGDTSPLPVAALMILGFLISAAGHLYKSSAVIALGIFVIFVATALLQLGLSRS